MYITKAKRKGCICNSRVTNSSLIIKQCDRGMEFAPLFVYLMKLRNLLAVRRSFCSTIHADVIDSNIGLIQISLTQLIPRWNAV
jgi:hypothetical protein